MGQMNVKIFPKKHYFLLFFVIFIIGLPLFTSYAVTYVGSKNSDVYHYPSCHYVDTIKPENRVYFSSPEDAIAAGYRPCKGCNPPTSSSGGNDDNSGTGKSSSSISCTLSIYNVIIGNPVTVSGSITPSRVLASVRLLFTAPTGSLIEQTVTTDSSGQYSYNYNANTPGTWSVVANWAGDSAHNGAESVTHSFTVWSDVQPTAIEVDQTTTCTSIVDGDSFYTTYGEVRLADLDCPDQGDSGYSEARSALSSLILNENIILDIDDLRGTDQYDRYICVAYIKYNTTHLRNVNHYMVSNGYAVVDDYTNNEFSPYSWQPYAIKPSKQVSCAISPSRITKNESIAISGTISPPEDSQTVALQYTMPDGTLIERDVVTLTDGSYSDSYSPLIIGSWTVNARVSGDQLLGDGSSVTRSFQVTKLISYLSCQSTATSISLGESVILSGILTPHLTSEVISIAVRQNAGWTVLTTVTTDSDGRYEFSWTPSAGDDYSVKASWAGDSDYDAAESDILAMTVTKLSSSVTCEATTSSVVVGEQVVFHGILDPIRSSIEVTLQQQTNTGWISLNSVTTDNDGRYSYLWTPSTIGSYQVRASVVSDNTYVACVSSSYLITVDKITPNLTCDVASSEITLEDAVLISGAIDPIQEGASIELQCTINGQTMKIATVTTNNVGHFVYQWIPSAAGSYQIHAICPGDAVYDGVTSPSTALSVNSLPTSEWMYLAPVLIIAVIGFFFYQRSRTK
jgi:endonuclease YncB( thermonuclease family)/5-hydroxyisourate hydrolase-like protein (transthyretin family)